MAGPALRPSVNLKNISLEVSDVGKYLERLGYPRTVQRGTAELTGKLSWVGNPQFIDYPTLAGHLDFKAYKGQFLKAEPALPGSSGFSACSPGSRSISASFSGAGSPSIWSSVPWTSPTHDDTKNFRMRGPSRR